jgi:peptidyl-prolyl cis-trans isomerase A (cyclophilin A)
MAWAACLALLIFMPACGGDVPEGDPPVARSPLLRPERFTDTAPATFQVELETSAGDVLIQLHRDWAPLGVDRFYNLVSAGYYDDSRIHRVVPGFMAQFGVHADPYVTQAWKSEFLVDDPVTQSNTRGRVTFAKGAVHTRTTHVFINYGDNSALDEEGFAPIGEVIDGMDVVDAFYAAYGDGPPRGDGPYQAMAEARGNEYLDAEFPELTKIVRATVLGGR